MIVSILQVPDPRLLQPSLPVEREALGWVAPCVQDLIDTCIGSNALGLSAVQIGKHLRIIAVSPRECLGFSVMINPEIIKRGKELVTDKEGCMSISRGVPRFPVQRNRIITVKFWDRAGADHEIVLKGLGARLVQHEVDHLDGFLIRKLVPRLRTC